INYVLPMGSISEVENLVLIGNALNGTGNELNNNIIGNNLDNTINGGAGNDTLDGGTGNDKINGQDGNDILLGGAGNDKYDGGNGFDEVVFNTQVTIDLATPANNTGDAKGDSYVNIELFVGSNSDDRFVGGNGADGFFGGAGNDIIYGNGGNDGLEGGAGADQLNGGPGVNQVTYQHSAQGVTVLLQDNNPAIVSGGDAYGDLVLNFQNVTGSQSNDVLGSNAQANILEGLGGDDILKAGAAIGPADTFDGGTGSDTMDYSLAGPTGITITLDKNGNATGVGGLAAGDTLISIENLIGGGGNDVLSGNASANVINGGGGSDTIKGGGGGDTLDGGDGIDTISYAWVAANQEVFVTLGEPGVSKAGGTFPGDNLVNFENIIGHAGYDVLGGNSLANIINGGGGDDIIIGGAGADTLIGGTGNDTVAYVDAGAAVTVNLKLLGGQLGQGLPGEDSFGDVLSGFENITGSKHDDKLTGDNNNNVIEGGAGADIMGGGLGSDTLSYQFSSMAVTVTLMGSNAADVHGGDAEGDTALNFENIKGSGFNDILGGDLNVNTLDGFSGLDTADYSNSAAAIQITLDSLGNATGIGGLAAGDHLISIENLTGGAGNDTLTGNDFVNVLMGGGGDDLLVGNGGGDTLDGGQGFDTVSYAGSGQPVIVTLGIAGAETTGINGDAAGDKISNVENITGSAFGDILSGNEQANVIHGGGGDDFIEGGAGSDILTGDGGIDTISYAHSTDGVTINLKLAGPQAVGGDGTGDTLSGFESILGSDHDDNLTGSAGNNTIEGGAGADTLSGGGGVDTLSYNRSSASVSVTLHGSSQADTSGGDAQGDIVVGFMNVTGSSHDDILTGDNNVNVIKGGAGSDTITGGLGADILTGGNPNDGISDTFVYNALAEKGDHITDFVGGVDVIAINAAGFGIAGAADFSSSATPTPPAGNATFLYDTDNGNLFFDDDGTGAHARVLLLTLDGHPSLAQGDIHLV
ncbi:MAG: beta strand repeat-containing protein, partial [Pseudolabrys sp.]